MQKKIDLQYNSPSVEEGFVPGRNKLKILVITKALIFDCPKTIIRHKKKHFNTLLSDTARHQFMSSGWVPLMDSCWYAQQWITIGQRMPEV